MPRTSPPGSKGSSPGPDDWQHLEDAEERRRVQNRLSQRNRRQNLKIANSENRAPQRMQYTWVRPNATTAVKDNKPPRRTQSTSNAGSDTASQTSGQRSRQQSTASRGSNSGPLNPIPDNFNPSPGSTLEEPQKPITASIEPMTRNVNMVDDVHCIPAADALWLDASLDSPSMFPLDPLDFSKNDQPMFDASLASADAWSNPSIPKSSSGSVDSRAHSDSLGSSYVMDAASALAQDPSFWAGQPADTCYGLAALHVAARNGNLPIVQMLVDSGMPIDQLSAEQQTPLHLAVECGHQGVANYLLKRGAAPYVTDRNGHTALHVAASQGQTAIVAALLDHVHDPNQLNSNGYTALHTAVASGQTDVVRLMLERGVDGRQKIGLPGV